KALARACPQLQTPAPDSSSEKKVLYPARLMLALLLALLAADADLQFLKDLSETKSWRLGRPTSVRLTPDGSRVLFLRTPPRKPENRLYSFDVEKGEVRELITPEEVLKGGEEQLSAEERARRERMRVTLRVFTSYD